MHVRTQIRHRFRDVLDAALSSSYVIYGGRKRARNDTGQALVNIVSLNDQQSLPETQGDARIRTASIYVRVQRSGVGDALDDQLDADEVAVTEAIMAADWSDLLEELPESVQTNSSDSGEAGRDVSEVVIRFDCEYRIDRFDLETAIP